MVRKVSLLLCTFALIFGLSVSAQGATHDAYQDGSLSTTYVTYFKDILSGVPFGDNYVAFRSGQYSYTMVTGDLSYEDSSKSFVLSGEGRIFNFTTSSGYNASYNYDTDTISNFSLNAGDAVIYSDLGHYPELIERGAKYEMLSAVLLVFALLCLVVGRIFSRR